MRARTLRRVRIRTHANPRTHTQTRAQTRARNERRPPCRAAMAAATEPHCTAGAIAFLSHLVASEERQELPPANAVGGAGTEDGRVDRRRHDEIAVASERVRTANER